MSFLTINKDDLIDEWSIYQQDSTSAQRPLPNLGSVIANIEKQKKKQNKTNRNKVKGVNLHLLSIIG